MSRRIYESDKDRAAEQSAARSLCDPHKIVIHKLPMRYEVDYMLQRYGELYGWLEVKVRPGVERYDTFMIGASKVDAGCRLAERFGGRFLILVRRTDDLMVLDAVVERPAWVDIGGRKDRGDDQDVEPVCKYRWDQFTRT